MPLHDDAVRWLRRSPIEGVVEQSTSKKHFNEVAEKYFKLLLRYDAAGPWSSSRPLRRRLNASESRSMDARNREDSLVLIIASGMIFYGPSRSARDIAVRVLAQCGQCELGPALWRPLSRSSDTSVLDIYHFLGLVDVATGQPK